jgi:hypothetical protein
MKLRALFAFLLVILMGGWLSAIQESQPQVWPEFYGFYVQAEGQLTSIPKTLISYAFPPEIGFDRACISGVAFIPANDFKVDRLKLVLFQQGAEKEVPGIRLTKLTYQKQIPLGYAKKKPGAFDQEYNTDVFMWVSGSEIQLQKGPVQDRPEMYQLLPMVALEPGVYTIHWGHIGRKTIPRPGSPFGTETPSAYVFSINIDQVAEAANIERPASDVIAAYRPTAYSRMEATQDNLSRLLGLAHSYLKTRGRPQKSSDYLDDRDYNHFYLDVVVNLNNASLSLLDAFKMSSALSQTETNALIKDWLVELQEASKLVREKQSGWKTKSYDKERKVRLGVSKLLKAEDKE